MSVWWDQSIRAGFGTIVDSLKTLLLKTTGKPESLVKLASKFAT